MMIIDPPMVMYGPHEAISAWLDELATMPQREPEVQRAIEEAHRWMESTEKAAPSPAP